VRFLLEELKQSPKKSIKAHLIMMRIKIFNDPVYGFIDVPRGLILDLIDHAWFQRLRRIKQTGMASFVYPGAIHTRFHHALGALYLMQEAVAVLRRKGVDITEEEQEAVCVAILLHDIGHGPFSHALEHSLVDMHHEDLSLKLMQRLNQEFGGRLNLAIEIFTDMYARKFFHQLVSGQLDMDRMDYLNRDSFYTGVTEGMIGYDRIIKMLYVIDDQLVVEEKGIYSIEKFLMARRFMYLQVYAHKTSLAAEQMLIALLARAKELVRQGIEVPCTPCLAFMLNNNVAHVDEGTLIGQFVQLDDSDITVAMKQWSTHEDVLLSFLAAGLTNRRLFRLEWQKSEITDATLSEISRNIAMYFGREVGHEALILKGVHEIRAYDPDKEQILIAYKDGKVDAIENCADVHLYTLKHCRYFVAYPKYF
jgi:uncharacterized protein